MRRNGFTMVELIFVIIIIGILSVAAIPKFGDIKDRAKVNAEYSSLSGLDGAIIAKMEFSKEDNGNILIDWHSNIPTGGKDISDSTKLTAYYKSVNDNKKVLKSILKKGDDFKIVAYANTGDAGTSTSTGVDDILFIKGTASNASTGVTKVKDVIGKPDKNDVWVFNGSSAQAIISYWDANASSDVNKTVESGEIALIDLNDVSGATTSTPTSFITTGGAATAVGQVGITSAIQANSSSAATAIVDSGL